MPETFTPKTWLDDPVGGTPITAVELNRMESGIESMDDRVTAAESSITSVTSQSNSNASAITSLTGRVTTLEAGGGAPSGGGISSTTITTISVLTNAQYNGLGTKSASTLYLVTA